jgi:hypothetical protein
MPKKLTQNQAHMGQSLDEYAKACSKMPQLIAKPNRDKVVAGRVGSYITESKEDPNRRAGAKFCNS